MVGVGEYVGSECETHLFAFFGWWFWLRREDQPGGDLHNLFWDVICEGFGGFNLGSS